MADIPRRVAIAGFGPFGGCARNGSAVIVEALHRHPSVGPLIAASVVLPVEYDRCFAELHGALDGADPDVLVCFGQTSRARVALERVARNEHTATLADEGGKHRSGAVIDGAPPTLDSTLPLEVIAAHLALADIEFDRSDDAGGYVCNHLFYRVMADAGLPGVRGFVHVPSLEEWGEAELVRAGATIVAGAAASDPRVAPPPPSDALTRRSPSQI